MRKLWCGLGWLLTWIAYLPAFVWVVIPLYCAEWCFRLGRYDADEEVGA